MSFDGLLTKELLAQTMGVSANEIDRYVACDLLSPIRSNGDLLFRPNDVVRIEIILKGERLGYSLQEVRLLMAKLSNGRSP